MAATAEIVQMDNYRVGSPFLQNLPSLNIPLPDNNPFYKAWIAGLEDQVIVLLNKYNFDWYKITVAAQRCPLRVEPANETILVLSHRNKPMDESRKTTIAGRKACALFDFRDVNVEITDTRGLKSRKSFTIGDGEPILAAWPNLKSQIIEILGDNSWLAIELLRHGIDDDGISNPITIVITINESSTSD